MCRIVVQVGYCGLNSVFGRITTSLLKQSPCIQKLTIYDDEEGSSPSPSPHQTNLFIGQDSLFDALKDVNIVVIGDECYDLPDSNRLKLTGRKIKRYTEAIMQCSPTAIVVVAASPLNIVVPLASYMLGPDFSKRVLGSTCHDTLRASRLLNGLLSDRYQSHRLHVLPVIGGATQNTRVPLFSQIYPQICMTDAIREKILDRMRLFNTPSYQDLDAMERAYSTVRFVHSLIVGITRGSPVPEITLSKSIGHSGFEFYSRPALLDGGGIQREFPLPELDIEEERILADVTERLNTDAQDAVHLANHLQDENQEEHEVLASVQHLVIDDVIRTNSNINRNDKFQEGLYKAPFAKIEEKSYVVPERHPVNDKFRKEQKEYPEWAKKNHGDLPMLTPWIHSEKSQSQEISHTNLKTSVRHEIQDLSNQCPKQNIARMSLHACRLLEESHDGKNKPPLSADISQKTAELPNMETDVVSDLLQEEVSKHLETLKSPIKSATQKFVELQQAKELEGDTQEASDSSLLADSERISSILNCTTKENQLKLIPQKQNATRIQPQEINGEVAGINCLHNFQSHSEQKRSYYKDEFSKFATANKEHGTANQVVRDDADLKSSKTFSAQDTTSCAENVTTVTVKIENPVNESQKPNLENMSASQQAPKDENVVDRNERTEYFCIADNINSSEKEQSKMPRSNLRRPSSTPNLERTEDFSAARNSKAKSSKPNKPGVKYGKDQTSKGKSVGKLMVKKSKNSINSVATKGIAQKTASEIEPTKHSVVSKSLLKPFQRHSKTKTAAEIRIEGVDTPTPHTIAGKQSEKFNSHKKYYDVPTSLLDHKIAETEPSLSNAKARGTKPMLLMSGHSDPEKPSNKSVQPLSMNQNGDAENESAETEKPKFSEASLNSQTDASGLEEIPEVRPEVDDPATPDAAMKRKMLTTDRTKEYYLRERRVPQDTLASSSCNRGSGSITDNVALDSKISSAQPELETKEDGLKEILPTEEPKTNFVIEEKTVNNKQGNVIDAEHNTEGKWDSKYLSIASDMLYKFFKDSTNQSKNFHEIKSKFLSNTNDIKADIQLASIHKQFNDFADSFNYPKRSKLLVKEISLDNFANSGRVKVGLGKSRLSASDLNYKSKAKYTEAKPSKLKRKPSASVIERGNMKDKHNVRLNPAKSSRRISDKNQQNSAGEIGKSSNAITPEKSRTRCDEPGQAPLVASTEITPTEKSLGDDKKINFDQLFKESSQIPILEVRSKKMFLNKSRENSENSKNVRPLSKLQANTPKLEEVMPAKLPKVTPDKRRDTVNLFDFSIRPKSDLPNTDSWEQCTKSEPRKKPSSAERMARTSDSGVSDLEVIAPKPNTNMGNVVPFVSKTIKQANVGQLGNSGPLRRNTNAESPKPNKWERVFTVFKQILINDVEGKSSGTDSYPVSNDISSDHRSANSNDDPSTVNSRHHHKNRPSRSDKPIKASQSQISSRLSKTHKSQTAMQKKKHLVEGLKRRKFVPKNSPKKIVNYFSQRVEPSEPQKMANVSTASGCEMPSVK